MTKAKITYNPGWLGLVGVIFVLCKVLEFGVVATWSWWLVLLPFYAGLAIACAILFGGAAIAVVGAGALVLGAAILDQYNAYKKRRARKAADKAKTWDILKGDK